MVSDAITNDTLIENTPHKSNTLTKRLKKNHDKTNGIELLKSLYHNDKTDENGNLKNIIQIDDELNKEPITKEKKQKTIQFNIDPHVKVKTAKTSTFLTRRSSVHEKLTQLKVEAIKKRRLNSERKESLKDKKSKKKTFDFKIFNKSLELLQRRTYYFLQRPTGFKGFAYRLFTFTIILGSIITGALTTIKSLDSWSFKALFYYEIVANVYFSIELLLRFWSCTLNTKYIGFNGRVQFLLRPVVLIEIFVIITSSLLLFFNPSVEENQDGLLKPLTILKFIQIFRFFYVDRKGNTWTLLLKVVLKHRFELLTSAYIGIIILLFSSYLILLVEKPYSEKNNDNHFHSYSDAVYWSIITMATIGYGDRSPRTFYGKLIATGLCIIGVSFWTLPSGIIGSGFALKVEQKNKKKQFNRLVPAAATLIQSWWRMKASLFLSSSNTSCLVATIKTFDISNPIISQSLRRLKKNIESANNEEMFQYFVGLDQPMSKDELIQPNEEEEEKDRLINDEDTMNRNDYKFVKNYLSSHSSVGHSSNEETSLLLQLSPEHLILIRTILLLKFLASKQKFKLAFKPYNFKDVIEQYTQGNMDVLLKMKDLQRKIEKVYDQVAVNRLNDNYNTVNYQPRKLYLNQQQLNSHDLSTSPTFHNYMQNMQQIYDYPIYENTNTNLNDSIKRKQHRSTEKRFLKSTSLDFGESFENENNLLERIDNVETKMDELSLKFDKLIEIFENKNNNLNINTDNV